MKEVILIIRPEKLEQVKLVLDTLKCSGMTILTVMGCGRQKGIVEEPGINVLKGYHTNINLLPKVRVEVVVKDSQVEHLIEAIRDKISTGSVGDGKAFIRPVEDVIRLRTGERGEKAL